MFSASTVNIKAYSLLTTEHLISYDIDNFDLK